MAELKTVNKQQNKITKHINKLEKKVVAHDKEIKDIRKKQIVVAEKMAIILSDIEPPFNPKVTLVGINSPYYANEDTDVLARHLLHATGCGEKDIMETMCTQVRGKKQRCP